MNSRAFWIAITAWSAKLRSRLHSFSLNGFMRRAADEDRADGAVLPQHGRERHRIVFADTTGDLAQGGRNVGIVEYVGVTDQAALAEGHLARGPLQRHRVQRADALGVGAVRRADMEQSIIAGQVYEAIIAAKQMLDAAQDLVEYRLGVGDRAADDPEDIRGRLLLFQRLPASR